MSYKKNQDILLNDIGRYLSESTIYSRYIKYRKLDEILQTFITRWPREINIFIDLTTMLIKLYTFENLSNPLGILSCIVNIPLHYRHYFNKLGIKSNIFLIYSSNDSSNNYKYIAGYNSKERISKEYNNGVHSVIINLIDLLGTLTPYFPGIYLKKGTVEPTVITYDLISKFSTNPKHSPTLSLFLTSTDYAYQLPVYAVNSLLIYKKNMITENNKAEDVSFGVSKNNALNTYISFNNKQLIAEPLNQEWISAFMTLNGLACRDVKMILSYKRTLSILKQLKASYNTITPENLYMILHDTYKEKQITLEELYSRYCAIDLNYQLALYRQLPESMESNFLIDIYDQQALYDISNRYFTGVNTIDFNKL